MDVALPGIPGTSHLYHVVSTDFFLDQPTLALTPGQKASLNAIKERALLDRAKAERAIAQAEEELWTLTGADQPDCTRIQSKLQEVEKLRTTQRLAFIRAVGDTTTVLTTEQNEISLFVRTTLRRSAWRRLGTSTTPSRQIDAGRRAASVSGSRRKKTVVRARWFAIEQKQNCATE